MEKFRKCRFADVGKSELGKKKKETCAKHKIDRSRTGDLMMTLMKVIISLLSAAAAVGVRAMLSVGSALVCRV